MLHNQLLELLLVDFNDVFFTLAFAHHLLIDLIIVLIITIVHHSCSHVLLLQMMVLISIIILLFNLLLHALDSFILNVNFSLAIVIILYDWLVNRVSLHSGSMSLHVLLLVDSHVHAELGSLVLLVSRLIIIVHTFFLLVLDSIRSLSLPIFIFLHFLAILSDFLLLVTLHLIFLVDVLLDLVSGTLHVHLDSGRVHALRDHLTIGAHSDLLQLAWASLCLHESLSAILGWEVSSSQVQAVVVLS